MFGVSLCLRDFAANKRIAAKTQSFTKCILCDKIFRIQSWVLKLGVCAIRASR